MPGARLGIRWHVKHAKLIAPEGIRWQMANGKLTKFWEILNRESLRLSYENFEFELYTEISVGQSL